MFDDLRSAWISKIYESYRMIILPTLDKQMSVKGLYLDLDSLPLKPLPFKEYFIRWLIAVNKQRLEKGLEIVITYDLVMKCPIWQLVKCPIKSVKLTKEGMFNKPSSTKGTTGTFGTIGTIGTIGSINK